MNSNISFNAQKFNLQYLVISGASNELLFVSHIWSTSGGLRGEVLNQRARDLHALFTLNGKLSSLTHTGILEACSCIPAAQDNQ